MQENDIRWPGVLSIFLTKGGGESKSLKKCQVLETVM